MKFQDRLLILYKQTRQEILARVNSMVDNMSGADKCSKYHALIVLSFDAEFLNEFDAMVKEKSREGRAKELEALQSRWNDSGVVQASAEQIRAAVQQEYNALAQKIYRLDQKARLDVWRINWSDKIS